MRILSSINDWSEETPQYLQDPKSFLSLEKYKRIAVFLWAKGCLNYATKLLDTKSGSITSIDKFTKNRKNLYLNSVKDTSYVVTGTEIKKTSVPWKVKKDDIFEVILFDGSVIKVNKTHEFYKFKYNNIDGQKYEWVELQNLKVGDKIAVTTYEYDTNDGSYDSDLAWLVGAYLGDGVIMGESRSPTIILNKDKRDFRGRLEKTVDKFDCTLRDAGPTGWSEKARNIRILGNGKGCNFIRRELLSLGFKNKNCYNKDIPKEFFKYNKKIRIELLRGMLETDGWVSTYIASKIYNSKVTEIGYSSASKQLAYDYKMLLSSLGIHGSLQKYKVNSKYGIHYRVRVRNEYHGKKLLSLLGWEHLAGWENKNKGIHTDGQHNTTPIFYKKIKSIEYVGRGDVYDLEVPDNHNYVDAMGFVNHNSGKGTTGALLMEYVLYLLSCMNNPFTYYKIAEEDPLDVVTVATNERQAQKLFKRISTRILHNKWFLDRYIIYNNGKHYSPSLSKEHSSAYGVIVVLKQEVIFQNSNGDDLYRLSSLHSKNESWEGLTIIAALVDELSGMQTEVGQIKAEQIIDTIETSTRELPSIIVITSFPRMDEDHDFTYKKYRECLDYPDTMFGSNYMTWEVKPSYFFTKGYFDFIVNPLTGETVKVPNEYKNKFMRSPEECKLKYLARPGAMMGDFYEWPGLIDLTVKKYKPLAYAESKMIIKQNNRKYLQKVFKYMDDSTEKPVPTYFLALDGGKKESAASLAMGHLKINRDENGKAQEELMPICVIDTIILWEPNVREKILVDTINMIDIIRQLVNRYNVQALRIDIWNAAFIEDRLDDIVEVIMKNVTLDAYAKTKGLIYDNCLELPNDRLDDTIILTKDTDSPSYKFINQCKSLKSPGAVHTKPRVLYGKQDIIDSVCNLVDLLYENIDMDSKKLPNSVAFHKNQSVGMINTGAIGNILGGAANTRIPISPDGIMRSGIVSRNKKKTSGSRLPTPIVLKS